MNRIILAYAHANAGLAQRIDNQLSRIGIPFEHISSANGNLAPAILAAGEPVLLLVTENLLTERSSMQGLMEVLQRFPADTTLLPLIAEGRNEQGEPVATHIDRMVNMLHYMNHWQNEWLKLSSSYQGAGANEKNEMEAELDAVRHIANHAGDVITLLRERGAVEFAAFEANDFALFFQKFGLSDWHGQYRRLAAHNTEQHSPEADHLPETPLSSGILAPEPVEEILPVEEELLHETEPESSPEKEQPEQMPLPQETETAVFEKNVPDPDLINQTIQDARFWIDRGHAERGIELLKTALEEYPEEERLAKAYREALPPAQQEPAQTAPEAPAVSDEKPEPVSEAHSYELMGDLAAGKGDYLFAKYCWDRVSEVDPHYPGIYRKLGLMCAEHLHDHRGEAILYLQKALESNAGDVEVKNALSGLLEEESPRIPTAEPAVEMPEVLEVQAPKVVEARTPPGTVLVTGATSGIGRATAELFARHGYRLILTGRRVERLIELKNQLESAYGTEAILLPFDVRDHGAVQAALDNLPESFRDIDILINNAGLAKGLAPVQEGNVDHWEQMIDTNVKGLLYVSRAVSPGMVARKKGHIINVCSSAGKEVYPNGNVYCATKFAVDALTRGMRLDLHAHNIRVSQVSPGHVEETEFAITRFDGDAERAKIYNDFQPLKSSDVAEVIFFMATRPAHVNIQDVQLFSTQQASSTVINRSGR